MKNHATTTAAMALVLTRWPHTARDLDELLAAQAARIESQVGYARARLATPAPAPYPPAVLAGFLAVVLPEVLRRRELRALRAAAGGARPPGVPTLADEVLAVVAGLLGPDEARAALAGLKAYLRGQLAAELAAAEAALEPYRTPVGWDRLPAVNGRSGVETLIAEAARLEGARAELAARVAALEPTEPDPVKAAGRHVAAAVAAAGGPERVASLVAETRRARGAFYAADPAGPEIAAAEAHLADVEADLTRLGGLAADPAPGSHAAQLVGRRADLAAHLAELRAVADARQPGAIADTVARACDGDADARATLEADVRARRSAFPEGFAKSLRWVGQVTEDLDGLAAELARRFPPAVA